MNQPWSSLAVPPDAIIIAQNGSPSAYVLPTTRREQARPKNWPSLIDRSSRTENPIPYCLAEGVCLLCGADSPKCQRLTAIYEEGVMSTKSLVISFGHASPAEGNRLAS